MTPAPRSRFRRADTPGPWGAPGWPGLGTGLALAAILSSCGKAPPPPPPNPAVTARNGAAIAPAVRRESPAAAAVGARSTWNQFRGPNRDGKSADTGLRREWPADGPALLWAVEDLGFGYSTVAVADGVLYTTGLANAATTVYALDSEGRYVWQQTCGPGWTKTYPGSRSTPTVSRERLTVMTGNGRVVCLDRGTGDIVWAVDTQDRFKARVPNWGMAESLLVDEPLVFCTPGGSKATVAALDTATGDTVWACTDIDDTSAYCSPILVQRGPTRILITLLAKGLVGIDADKGRVLWQHARSVPYDIHAVSPVYADGLLYVTSGYGGARGELFELSADGKKISKRWSDEILDCQLGGVILHRGYLFGASDRNRGGNWVCLDLNTGAIAAEHPGVGKGAAAYADGMLYTYGESGRVGLLPATPDAFQLVSSFAVTRGTQQHWALPVVADGRLYIRHGTALMAYDVRGARN